ncbi:BCAS2 domain-containing protein [Coccidioides immitis RS]|uniref:BCAS2 domain-containing protein n=4 Tax=Coccidioides immitis TaxID=5501 RepID=J3KCJ1_COCIM|nr:BCAS2 domain-containing protein [Coccidioides immitis RS]KMP08233.1 breast carcinoma amplified sequence 2 variant [Coccidioides immitis RMSCC 2394]KMU79490.1 hypothetical protein CISG_01908 [Coccidioides immitis RMSCC 3703]KMU89942.1 breast carcinoma amplified sequence 2 variant [Coccidioides immitis H538.4]TPX19905.1 hypothetical protein DIZ76_017699 [Coccidioides immitis]EAS32956.3 BCAS2 domain-containing protein [Coccidioides immitis RS]
MSLINEFHDSLPYIDGEIAPEVRTEIDKLIAAELPAGHRTTLHPSIPTLPEPKFSALIQSELERKANSRPITGGVDLSRYEAPEAPSTEGKDQATILSDWRETLRKAYTASSHLTARQENLSLLEAHGKNAWLIGNAQLEEILRQVEKEIQETKQATDEVNRERKMRQETARGEIEGLEDAWKRGVSGIINVELAAEKLRMEILEKRRQQARS